MVSVEGKKQLNEINVRTNEYALWIRVLANSLNIVLTPVKLYDDLIRNCLN